MMTVGSGNTAQLGLQSRSSFPKEIQNAAWLFSIVIAPAMAYE
jgi:hypothetical protein